MPSFDCNHTGEKGPTRTPACRVQGPVPFGGEALRYPHVREGAPGGVP